MTVISRIVSSSHPEALICLEALASIAGLGGIIFSKDPLLNEGSNLLKVEMIVTAHNLFNSSNATFTAHSLLGCARLICKAVPESGLWGQLSSSTGMDQTMIESWIETASDSLSSAAYVPSGGEKERDAVYKKQVEAFVASIESHLFATSNTFLVGDYATAADVIVSILIADAVSSVGLSSIPEQAARLVQTVLNNPVVVKSIGKLACPEIGMKSPSEKEQMKPTDVEVTDIEVEVKTAIPEEKSQESEEQKVSAPTSEPNSAVSTEEDFADNVIVKKFEELAIPHHTYAHKLSVTVDELVVNVPLPEGETHTKNVFFKDKKHGLFLVTVKPDSHINTKKLGKDLGLKGKVNLRMADEKILMNSLGVKKGCVGPLSIMNNTSKDVKLVLDERLFSTDVKKISSHPLRNDMSTSLLPSDLKKFLEGVGVDPAIVSFEIKDAPPSSSGEPSEKNGEKEIQPKQQKQKTDSKKNPKSIAKKASSKKGDTLLALQWKKSEDFASWYSDVIVLSEMISYYDISGCYILRPWSYKMWELIQDWFNVEIQNLGVENSYFPMFVSKDRLEKEKDHVEGFAPEVAWVTKSGDGDLTNPIAVRPTSETIMYPAFSDWIKSHRDLPLKLNQWSNVVRWEFKYPTPFLRTREFLWQEGHTAHTSFEDANVMVMQALDLYRQVYEDLLAVPVVPGYKTEKEKFAGGHQTTTVEAYIAGSGRAIQGATSHNLGQNFGKMFDISFQDSNGKSQIAWQTSWGLTTRTIGVMVMVHGDDKGLVLPPRIAPLQVVIVPIVSKKMTADESKPYCQALMKELTDVGIRVKYDDRTMYNPGWKYNHWEQKGVPIRVEVGPRDIENKSVRIASRVNGEKEDLNIDGIGETLKNKLEFIQKEMFQKAKVARDDHLVQVTEWKDFVPNLEKDNMILTPWCGGEHQDWEEWVKDKSKEESLKTLGKEGEDEKTSTSVAAKTLCIPFKQPVLPEGTKCIASGLPATCWVLWGRSY